MSTLLKLSLTLAGATIGFGAACGRLSASDNELIPSGLPKEQRESLQRFLKDHEKPERFLPRDAKLVGTQPGGATTSVEEKPGQAVKQYLVQITPHRPVPGQEEVKRADVY